jgi:hypothetical protein
MAKKLVSKNTDNAICFLGNDSHILKIAGKIYRTIQNKEQKEKLCILKLNGIILSGLERVCLRYYKINLQKEFLVIAVYETGIDMYAVVHSCDEKFVPLLSKLELRKKIPVG